jgi:diguanylate cyclase (GGDEF)-like protein
MENDLNPGVNKDGNYQSILELVYCGVVVLSKDGVVRYLNPAAKNLLQLLPEEYINEEIDWDSRVGQTFEFEHANPGAEPSFLEITALKTDWAGEQVYLLNIENVTKKHSNEKMLRQELDDAETRNSELEILRFVSDHLNRAALLDETIQAGLETVQQVTNASAVWVLLPDEDEENRLVLVSRQFKDEKIDKELLQAPETCGCLERLKSGRMNGAVLVAPCAWMGQVFPENPTDDGHMAVPLKTADATIGLLNLVVPNSRRLNHAELRILETIGGQLAVAIERAKALSQKLSRFSRDGGLNMVSRAISSALDLPAVLRNILQLAVEMAGADAGILGLLSPDSEVLSFPFTEKAPEELTRLRFPNRSGVFWEVILNSRPVLMDGYHGVSDGLPVSFAREVMGALVTPITGGGKNLGVISLFSKHQKKKFTNFDMTLIESLGRQAGMAINNAQLFFEVQMLTTTDPLTGLTNQFAFNNQGIKEVERAFRYNRPLGLGVVVIDQLEDLKQQYGEPVASEAYKAVARACEGSLRRVDILSRYSDNEFALLLPETNAAFTQEVFERVRNKVKQSVLDGGGKPVPITVSIGVATQENREELDLETLLVRAEEALTDAVQAGGDRINTWKPED